MVGFACLFICKPWSQWESKDSWSEEPWTRSELTPPRPRGFRCSKYPPVREHAHIQTTTEKTWSPDEAEPRQPLRFLYAGKSECVYCDLGCTVSMTWGQVLAPPFLVIWTWACPASSPASTSPSVNVETKMPALWRFCEALVKGQIKSIWPSAGTCWCPLSVVAILFTG